MTRALYRCDTGAPFGYVDDDIGDPMVYALDGRRARWIGYINDDSTSVYDPDGVPLFSILDGYLCNPATGAAVLYFDDEGEAEKGQEDDELRDSDGMFGLLFRTCEAVGVEPIAFTFRQAEIIRRLCEEFLSVFDWSRYYQRVIEHLRNEKEIDDATVQRAAEQARSEFRRQQH
jgi:hypothetical protein